MHWMQRRGQHNGVYIVSDDQNILIKISRDVGKLCGSVEAFEKYQKDSNERIEALVEDHTKRITVLEGYKNRLIGIIIGSGTVSGAVVALLARFLP